MIDYSVLKKELLVALRGSRSQLEMSQLAGFSFNQWHKWETEQKWLRWDEFVDVLDQLNIPLREICLNLFTFQDDPKDFQNLIRSMCSGKSFEQVAEILKQDEETIRRWSRNQISPSIETVFLLIQSQQNNLTEFIGKLVAIDQVPSLKNLSISQLNHKIVEIEHPFSAAIEACLNLKAYKDLKAHSDEWISERTLISLPLVIATLKKLESAGTIKKIGNHYELIDGWIQMNGLPLKEAVKVDHYWTQRCLDRYSGPDHIPFSPVDRTNTNFRSFRVAAVSTEAALQIQARLKQASQDILSIIKDDKNPKTEIKVYVSHLFDVQDIHYKMTDYDQT